MRPRHPQQPFRGGAEAGEWCVVLLPVAMAAASFVSRADVTAPERRGVLILSVFMALHSLHVAAHLLGCHSASSLAQALVRRRWTRRHRPHDVQDAGMKCFNETQGTRHQAALLLSMFVVSISLRSGSSPVTVVLLNCCLLWLYIRSLKPMFFAFPASFSFGEGCLVLQGLICYLASSLGSLGCGRIDAATVAGSYTLMAHLGLLSLMLFCALPALSGFTWMRSSAGCIVTLGFALLSCVTLPLLWLLLRRNPLLWLLHHILSRGRSLAFVLISLVCLTASLLVVARQAAASHEKASTRTRKWFHAVIVVVYTAGLWLDVELLFFSSCVALAVQILCEYLRAVVPLSPLSGMLSNAFRMFADEKDQGRLILTNIYLLAGASLPLWLSGDLSTTPAPVLLSGVLAIGLGDSAASIVGSKLGRIRLPSSNKTMEGMAASVAAQLVFLQLMQVWSEDPAGLTMGMVLSVSATSLVEAVTDQVDNIVLPLVLFIFLNLGLVMP